MGMFDKPQYLTGDNGFASAGDTFWLHNARIDGSTVVGGAQRDNVKLLVSREREGEKVIVYTSGAGIANQVKRMDAEDRSALPREVRLDQIPPRQAGHNPTNVLTPVELPAPTGADTFGGSDDIPF